MSFGIMSRKHFKEDHSLQATHKKILLFSPRACHIIASPFCFPNLRYLCDKLFLSKKYDLWLRTWDFILIVFGAESLTSNEGELERSQTKQGGSVSHPQLLSTNRNTKLTPIKTFAACLCGDGLQDLE